MKRKTEFEIVKPREKDKIDDIVNKTIKEINDNIATLRNYAKGYGSV